MVVDHTSHIGFPPVIVGSLVVCATRDDTRRTGEPKSEHNVERVFEIP